MQAFSVAAVASTVVRTDTQTSTTVSSTTSSRRKMSCARATPLSQARRFARSNSLRILSTSPYLCGYVSVDVTQNVCVIYVTTTAATVATAADQHLGYALFSLSYYPSASALLKLASHISGYLFYCGAFEQRLL
jgi:hypothetical protein